MVAGMHKKLMSSLILAAVTLSMPLFGLIHEGILGTSEDLISDTVSSVHFSSGWEYVWADDNYDDSDYLSDSQQMTEGPLWDAIDLPINPSGRNGRQILWLRYPLPDGDWDQPSILITRLGVLLAFDAFVDGVNVYSFGKDYALGVGNFPGLTSHLIAIDRHMQGKTLTLKVFSDYANIGIRGKIYLGEKADLITAVIKKDIIKFVLSLFMIFIGIMDLVANRKETRSFGIISMFGILAISQGLYTINLTTLKDIVLFAPMLWFNIFITTMTLIPIGIAGFSWETFRPEKDHILYKILLFLIALGLVTQIVFILISYRWLSMDIGTYFLNAERLFMIFLMGILLFITSKDAFYKASLKAKIYLIGFLPIIACSIHDIFMGFGWIRSNVSYVPYGLMLFVLSLEIIQRLVNTRTHMKLRLYSKELERRAQEKEALIADLHDGIGGLITKIKFISEMVLYNSTEPKTKEALQTISSLSSDCLVEVGNFMQSLDQKIDWNVITDNLKTLGNRMVVQMGIKFNFKSQISSNAAIPETLLSLNLLRIYKEALTNVIKHAGAKNVDVSLVVQSNDIKLSVKDDGIGFKKDIKKGRGLNSMKTRATKLGGKINIQSGKGTCILFTFCSDEQSVLTQLN